MLNKLSLVILVIASSLLAVGAALQKQNESYVVQGRVVDEHGKAVANAEVEVRIIDEYINSRSDLDGRFRFTLARFAGMRSPTLYVTTERPRDVHFPLAPPFSETAKGLFPSLAGKLIQVKKEGLDLGDVTVQANYSQILVRLLDSGGAPLLTAATKAHGLVLRVRDNVGNIVDEDLVAGSALQDEQSAVAIGLPKGVWHIEITDEGDERGWRAFASPLIVEHAGDSLRATLRLSTDEQLAGQSQIRKSYSPEQARQELARLNIAYDNAAFIEQARMGNLATVELFLAARMNANVKNKYGVTALMEAAQGDFRSILSSLLDQGADVNAQTPHGTTALHIAVVSHRAAIVEDLLKRGANPNLADEHGCTALIFSSLNPDVKIASLLLAAGADVKVKDKTGRTALQWAIKTEQTDVAELLKQAGAKQ